jgi:type I restriction enzyme S subunit
LVSNIRPYLKKVWVADKEGGASNDVIVIRAKQNLLPQYFSCLLKNDAFIDYVMTGAKGVKMPRGDVGSMKAYRTLYPSKAEQQKIAECLRSVDELIAAQARKVAALKTHKKGLMQQLFPREGETRPRLRFPEFQDAGEWDDAPMGTLLMSSPDYGVNAAAVPFSDQLPKYLRITDISADGRYLPEKQVSVNLEATDWNYLDEGDIVLARTGASVGKSYQYRKEDGRLVFAGFLIRVKPHPKKLVSSFLANFLVTGKFWKWVAVNSARSGQPGINSTEYSSLTIPLPPTLREQHRLATCLSSLDTLITAETQKLETLKTHKKGLMQQLFPSLDEVKS